MKRILLLAPLAAFLFSCNKRDRVEPAPSGPPPATGPELFACPTSGETFSLLRVDSFAAWEQRLFPVAVSDKDTMLPGQVGYSTYYLGGISGGSLSVSFTDTNLLHYYAVTVNTRGAVIDRQDTLARAAELTVRSGPGQKLSADSCYRMYLLVQDAGGNFATFKGYVPYKQGG